MVFLVLVFPCSFGAVEHAASPGAVLPCCRARNSSAIVIAVVCCNRGVWSAHYPAGVFQRTSV